MRRWRNMLRFLARLKAAVWRIVTHAQPGNNKNHSVAPRTPGASRKKRPKTSGVTARHVSPAAESNRKMSLLVYAAEILLLFAVIALVVRLFPISVKRARENLHMKAVRSRRKKKKIRRRAARPKTLRNLMRTAEETLLWMAQKYRKQNGRPVR